MVSNMGRTVMGAGLFTLLLMAMLEGALAARDHHQPKNSRKKVKCKLEEFRDCHNVELECPSSCSSSCLVNCVSCKPVCSCDVPGAVCQDPRFIGGDGITFYFHGKKNKDFCLVSDSNLHINGHFIGKRSLNMKRDFTWVQSVGILFDNHQIYLGAQKTATWDDSVDRLSLSFDGEPIRLPTMEGAKWESTSAPLVTMQRSHTTNGVTVHVEGNFKIDAIVVPITEEESRVHGYGMTEEDCFAHLDLGFKFYSLSDNVSGVLGQTYARNYTSRAKMGVAMPVIGGDREFAATNLFAADCAVARFQRLAPAAGTGDLASISCGNGMDGPGVVCRR